jgi:hypothetical protein
MEETGWNMQNYISPSRKCINESRTCNLAEYGFMFSIDTRLSACNVMKAYNMYGGKILGVKFMLLYLFGKNYFVELFFFTMQI